MLKQLYFVDEKLYCIKITLLENFVVLTRLYFLFIFFVKCFWNIYLNYTRASS